MPTPRRRRSQLQRSIRRPRCSASPCRRPSAAAATGIPATVGGTRLRWIAFAAGVLGLILGAIARPVRRHCSAAGSTRTSSRPRSSSRSALIAIVARSRIARRRHRRGGRRLGAGRTGCGARSRALGDDRPLSAPARRTDRLALALGLVRPRAGRPRVARSWCSRSGRDAARIGWVVDRRRRAAPADRCRPAASG